MCRLQDRTLKPINLRLRTPVPLRGVRLRQGLTSVRRVSDELLDEAVLAQIDVPEPELNLLLDVGQQLFDPRPLLLLTLLGLSLGVGVLRLPGGWPPFRVNHLGVDVGLQ